MNQEIYIFVKRNKTMLFSAWLVALCGILFSCDSFVDTDQPNSQLTSSAVFESKATAEAAMTDIYAQIRENGIITGKLSGIGNLMGNYSDELIAYETGSYSSEPFYNNSILASNALISSMWNSAYNQIYAANAVINGVDNSITLAVADKSQLKGEALFVRALNHFYLVNIFGDVPYVTATDYKANSVATRMTTIEVYNKVIADLKAAIDLLPQDYVSVNRVRPNKATAQALLARVYLYTGAWSEASNMASAVLNNESLYVWDENLDNIFLKESTTTIWQLTPAYEGQNTEEGMVFIFSSGPPPTVALTNELMSSFTAGDLRKSHWTLAVTDGTDTWYHAFKYKEKTDTGATTEFSIIFRLAEQYLIRAEARAQQGDLIGAKEDLNKIRHTAGLTDTSANNASDIVDAIIKERRLEFFTEHGQRFFDLKRTGKLDAVLGNKLGWNSSNSLWPLPQSELQVNPYLKPQNPGY
ncbi:RagB/SusD family nutrient uptake outer membrane protein [Flavobacterium aquidurense]|uniref:RagB/SusD family nutrient uptake outer membrane protein n=1 Tax=Flavobacterium aquidurense TaxID=362413 RepID=UPI0037581916